MLFRDKQSLREMPLKDFLKLSEGFGLIPAWRIEEVRREGRPVYVRRPSERRPGKV